MGVGGRGMARYRVVKGWQGLEGDNELGMSLIELVFPTTTKKVIFLIFKELAFPKKRLNILANQTWKI